MATRDRLAEMNASSSSSSSTSYPPQPHIGGQQHQHQQQQQQQQQDHNYIINNARSILNGPPQTFNDFLTQHSAITELIGLINSNSQEMSYLNERSLNQISQIIAFQFRNRIDEKATEQKELIALGRTGINYLRDSRGTDPQTRERHYKGSLNAFREAIRKYGDVQEEIRDTNREQITRQIKIANPVATEDEIREAVNSGKSNVFGEMILSSKVKEKRQILTVVQERDQALRKLVESMEELSDLVNDLNTLINEQHTMMAEVEQRAEQAQTDIESGLKPIQKAIDHAKKARENKWRVFWIVLVVILIIIAVIAIYVGISNSNKK